MTDFRELKELVQVLGDEQRGAALPALFEQALVDVLGRADVYAARRLRGHEQRWLRRKFARHDHLLHIAA